MHSHTLAQRKSLHTKWHKHTRTHSHSLYADAESGVSRLSQGDGRWLSPSSSTEERDVDSSSLSESDSSEESGAPVAAALMVVMSLPSTLLEVTMWRFLMGFSPPFWCGYVRDTSMMSTCWGVDSGGGGGVWVCCVWVWFCLCGMKDFIKVKLWLCFVNWYMALAVTALRMMSILLTMMNKIHL